MENSIFNVGGILFSAKNANFLQAFFTFFLAFAALSALASAVKAFRAARKDNPVFSRGEVQAFIESQMSSIQSTLEDAGVDWDKDTAYQWLLFLCRKIKVRQQIVLVARKRYEAPGFADLHTFMKKADLRLSGTDVADRAADGTPKWFRTEVAEMAKDVQAIARDLAKNRGTRNMSTPCEYHRFKQNQ
jgi:hypothetical protein